MDWSMQEKAFLVGLEKLTRETGIVIGGCGCCGSPFLRHAESLHEKAGYGTAGGTDVEWISPDCKYTWERYESNIASKEGQ